MMTPFSSIIYATISNHAFYNSLTLGVVSSFRPNINIIRKNENIIHFHIGELNGKERETLFVRYSNLLDIELNHEKANYFLELMTGLPEQIYYCLDLIKENKPDFAIKHKNDIVKYNDTKVQYILDKFKENKTALNILTLLTNLNS